MHTDWQTLLTLAIGLAAAAYLAWRWWPKRSGSGQAQAACGSDGAKAAAASSCGSGCGQCGSGGPTPVKDHRVTIVPHTPHRAPH